MLLAFFSFVAFVSYLFTWEKDQDIARRGASALLPSAMQKPPTCWQTWGPWCRISFFIMHLAWLRLPFAAFSFVAGANLLFSKKLFSLRRNVKYVVAALVFFQRAALLYDGQQWLSLGRGLWKVTSAISWYRPLAKIGTSALLAVAGLAYIIWRFHPVFSTPKLPRRKPAVAADCGAEPVPVEDDAAGCLWKNRYSMAKRKRTASKATACRR